MQEYEIPGWGAITAHPLQASLLAGRGEAAAEHNAYQQDAVSATRPSRCETHTCASLGLMVDSERLAGAAWVHMVALTDTLGPGRCRWGEGWQGEGGQWRV